MHAAVAGVFLAERIENIGQKISADSLAGIVNGDFGLRGILFQSDTNSSARRREFDGVGQKIERDLL